LFLISFSLDLFVSLSHVVLLLISLLFPLRRGDAEGEERGGIVKEDDGLSGDFEGNFSVVLQLFWRRIFSCLKGFDVFLSCRRGGGRRRRGEETELLFELEDSTDGLIDVIQRDSTRLNESQHHLWESRTCSSS